MEEKSLIKHLNIGKGLQMFADDGGSDGGDGGQGTPKTYTQEDIDKLNQELAKQKGILDKVNAENKKYKDEAKAKLGEEEKAKLEQEEKEKQFQTMQIELRTIKMSNSLIANGYTKEQADKIIDLKLNGKDEDFTKYLGELRKSMFDEATKKAKEEFSKNDYVPNGASGGDGNGQIGMAGQIAKNQNVGQETVNTWGQFGNKK